MAGTLTLDLFDDYVPEIGEMITILSAQNINGDGEVNLTDLDLLGQYFGQSIVVPEPNSMLIIAMVLSGLVYRRPAM